MWLKPRLVLAALLLGACVSHVQMQPLPPQMTGEQRVEAYQRLRPKDQLEEVLCGDHGCGTPTKPLVVLGDGTTVREPDDLLVLVSPDSVTAREAKRAASLRTRSHWAYVGAFAGMLTGLGITVRGLTDYDHTWDGEGFPGNPTVAGIGATIAVGSMITGMVLAEVWKTRAAHHKRRAFESYDADLAQRLEVCAMGLQLVPCESPAPASAPLAPPGATLPTTPPPATSP